MADEVEIVGVEGKLLSAEEIKMEPEQDSYAGVFASVSDDEEDDDDDDDDDEDNEDEEESDGDEAAEPVAEPDIDLSLIDTESTIRYLRGDMGFEEFQSLLEARIAVRLDAEMGGNEEVVTTVQECPDTPAPMTALEKARAARKRNKGKKKSKLPRDLQGLMGEANMKFARGEHEEAVKMCMEVIRLVPKAHEPFQTLGMLYEELGDQEKALQFLLIAAHLNPTDHEEWVRLAEMSLEQNNIRQAISCYDKALKYDTKNMTYMWARCDLYEKMGDKKKAMEGYQQILSVLPKENGEKYMQLARDMTKSFHASGELPKALVTMKSAFDEHPNLVTAEDVNLLIELLMSQSMHLNCLEVLVQHCGVEVTYRDETIIASTPDIPISLRENEEPLSIDVKDEMPIDLRVKLVVSLIHLKFKMCIPMVATAVFAEGPDEIGDLYLDIAEAYMENGEYSNAQPILSCLVESNNYNLAAVWLRYAECLNAQGLLQKAVEAYTSVVKLAPGHMGARVSLSALQQQLGRYDDALHTLEQSDDTAEDGPSQADIRLYMPRCMLLYSQKKWDEFVTCASQVLLGQFKNIFDKKHVNVILSSRSMKHRVHAMRAIFGSDMEKAIRDADMALPDGTFTVEDLWELYMKVCKVLHELGRLEDLQTFTIVALMNPQFMHDHLLSKEADFACLAACMLNKNGYFAYNFVREVCVKDPDNTNAWNLFGQIVILSQDMRHNRFVLRLLMKLNNEHLPLCILNGNNALVAGTYKHALGEYVTALRQDPTNPMLSLLIACCFFNIMCQKFTSQKHPLVIQAMTFMNQYMEQRGECQETYYNLGRAMQQLGLMYAAVYNYEKALTFDCAIPGREDIFDLKREIAFNLCLIYRDCGNHNMANMLLEKYLVI